MRAGSFIGEYCITVGFCLTTKAMQD